MIQRQFPPSVGQSILLMPSLFMYSKCEDDKIRVVHLVITPESSSIRNMFKYSSYLQSFLIKHVVICSIYSHAFNSYQFITFLILFLISIMYVCMCLLFPSWSYPLHCILSTISLLYYNLLLSYKLCLLFLFILLQKTLHF